MYNTKYKYYLKKILDHKNDMWYFDDLVMSFNKKSRKSSKAIYDWAEDVLSRTINDDYLIAQGFQLNPLFEMSNKLRSNTLQHYQNCWIDKSIKVFIHLPPISFSVGGHSWLYNLGLALEYIGITVEYFWESCLFNTNASNNLLLSIGSKHISDKLNWDLINLKKSTINLKVVLHAAVDVMNETELNSYIDYYLKKGADGFFSFNSIEFINNNTSFFHLSKKKSFILSSLEFSANPLIHYAPKFIKPDFDFIFIGSSNYDKAKRYYDFFIRCFKKNYKALVVGPGWDWINNYKMNPARDRLLYSRAKVGLNLHLDFQISAKRELNERTYILAAIGLPQIIDNPLLINEYFTKPGLISNNPEEYIENLDKALMEPEEFRPMVEQSLLDIYDRHTTFHRIIPFLKELLF